MRVRAAIAALALAACGHGAGEDVVARTMGDPARGADAIRRHGCGACHRIPGIRTARGLVGPPLDDVARRAFIAGTLPNTAPNLARWIQFPDSVRPGTPMPTLGLSAAEASDVVAYLYERATSGALGPPSLLPKRWLQPE